jgi:hypothetical protein
MIRIILGGIGSGKTLTAVMKMSESALPIFTNIQTASPNAIRLKHSMIMTDVQANPNTKHTRKAVNWDFWKQAIAKYQNFHIYIDELHNIMSARRSMSGNNICMAEWVSQIRKITGASEVSDFVVISQELSRIDVALRDLATEIIYCEKKETPQKIATRCLQNGRMVTKILPTTYIMTYYFRGTNCVEKYWLFRDQRQRTYDRRSYYLANGYFKLYDSYQIVDFGESEYV